jgi:hypothetical protein
MIKKLMIILAASVITGCAVHPGAPTIHTSTTYDYNTQGVTKIQDEYVTAATVINSRRSYEIVRYYEQREVCRTISNERATPYDVGAIAKKRCAIEEIPRDRRVQNGWIINFEYNGIIYEQYVAFNPGSVVLVRIKNNSIVGVNP